MPFIRINSFIAIAVFFYIPGNLKNMFVWWISSWAYGLCIDRNGIIPWYSLLWLFDGFSERWIEVAQSKRRIGESQGNSKNIANGIPQCWNTVVARMTHGEQRHGGTVREAPGKKGRGPLSQVHLFPGLFLNIFYDFCVKHLHSVYTISLFLLDVRS